MKQSWLKQLLMAIFVLPSMYAVSDAAEKATQFTPKVYGGNWAAAVGLGTARQFHTTTRLPNGILLTVGGYTNRLPPAVDELVPLATAERLNPALAASATNPLPGTAALTTARAEHTATLLPPACGNRVLVVGGRDGNNDAIRTAELYNPATNTWVAARMMATARSSHTATLLPGGGCRVLITGGDDNGYSPLSMAEIYTLTLDAAGNLVHTWTNAGSLANARAYHTATLLSDGRVLVTGGADNNNEALKTSEIYNPANNTWSMTTALNIARVSHTATEIGANVLVVGGANANNSGLNSAEIYDPATGLWTMAANFVGGRAEHTATLLHNGEVLIAGGSTGINNALETAQIYNPVTDAWRTTNFVMTGGQRYAHTATLMDLLPTPRNLQAPLDVATTYNNNSGGMVYLVGGSSGGLNTLATATRYTPTAITLQATIPVATTAGAAPIPIPNGLNNATLNGRVNTASADGTTDASFEYGLTTGYGTTVVAIPPVGTVNPIPAPNNVLVAATNVGGLLCNSIYNYRVRATDNATGNTVVGGNRTISTAACNRTDVTLIIVNTGVQGDIAANAGDWRNYTVTVANRGPANEPITNLRLRMPPVNYLTVTPTPGLITAAGVVVIRPFPAVGCAAAGGGVCPFTLTVGLLQGTGLIIPTLPRNATVTFSIGTRLALATPTMNLTYTAMLDVPPNRFVDINRSNNLAKDTDQIYGLEAIPDLKITGITLSPVSPAANTNFNATVTVKNVGTGAAGSFVVDVWPNQATVRGCRATNTTDDLSAAILTLAVGASKQVTIANIPTGIAGAKTFRAYADGTCRINEIDETATSNQMTKSYTVR